MVKHRRAQHTESGRKHSLSPDTRLTTRSNSAKRRRLHDATLTQASELVEPLRRRSSRQTVREQTNASELTAAARRARQPPAAGSKHRRSSGTLTQPVAGRAHRTADTPSQEQQQQVPEVSSDSRLQHPQAKSGVPNSTANTQQAEVHCELTSRSSIERSQQCTGSGQKNRQDGSGSTAGNGDQHAAQSTASAQPSQQSDAPASDQSVDDFAFEAQAQTPDSPRSEVQQSPKGTRRRAYGQRTHGTPHPTFQGVKTSTAGVKHVTEHPDVKQIWSAFVMVPSKQKHGSSRMLFLGKNYWSAEAAARAVDRANIALYGREAASTNFPLDWYGPEEEQRHGNELDARLKGLAGMRNNNPKNWPGVTHIKLQPRYIPKRNAATIREKNPDWQPKGKPTVDPAFALQLWERLTGGSASQAEATGGQPPLPWFRRVCGHCRPCRKAAKRKAQGLVPRKTGVPCTVLPKLRTAKRHLTKLAKESGQQRFAPADLDAFLESLPDITSDSMHGAGSVNPPVASAADPSDRSDVDDEADVGVRQMADLSFVPEERRGGVRQKGVSKGTRAMLKGKRRRSSPELSEDSADDDEQQLPTQLRRGRSQGLRLGRHAERAVTWTDAQLSTLQNREDALYEAQEHGRVLAADAAPHRGVYQPLLAAAPAGPDPLDRLKWPHHHAADLRHIQRCADKGKLVEVRNHDWWGPPALGSLGSPAAGLQGSTGHQPAQQQSRNVSCCWCKAQDHLVKDCPLNAYMDEDMGDDPDQEAQLAQHAAARAEQLARCGEKEAPAEWLSQVSQPVQDVMSAMQQMASVGVQANEQKDSSHSAVMQSMTPDALLACGLLVDELMRSQLPG
ncbi:hypothetical protein ABBQ38_014391 [Trebouxia sp. C0009 RCD-2024]